jgi:hypothetical protein
MKQLRVNLFTYRHARIFARERRESPPDMTWASRWRRSLNLHRLISVSQNRSVRRLSGRRFIAVGGIQWFPDSRHWNAFVSDPTDTLPCSHSSSAQPICWVLACRPLLSRVCISEALSAATRVIGANHFKVGAKAQVKLVATNVERGIIDVVNA